MNQEDLYALIQKYLSGQATAQEKEWLNQWYYQSFDDDEFSVNIDAKEAENEATLEQKMYSRLHESLQFKMVRKPAKIHRLRVGRYAAAAVLIILMGTGYYFGSKMSEEKNAKLVTNGGKIKDDVKPGGNKAVLTLANGSRIVLDSARSGTIAQQTDAKILKLTNKGLTYQAIDHQSKIAAVEYNTLSTPRGGQYQLQLADGSMVWLNAASSIRYPTAFTGSERIVEITGEVYFEVAHNSAMPFKVKVNNKAEVEVLGTHFNINSYDDESTISTTLLQGSIKLVAAGSQQSILLKPRQQALVSINGALKLIDEADVQEAVAWKNGMFEFNGNNIEFIMRQITRWYDVGISYQGNMADINFTGQISRYSNVSQVLKMLEFTKDVHFEIEGSKIKVMR